jgi:hypothetical protein
MTVDDKQTLIAQFSYCHGSEFVLHQTLNRSAIQLSRIVTRR